MEAAALRELVEETGHALEDPSTLISLGRFYALPSETNKYVNFFLAAPTRSIGAAQGDTEIEKYFDMSTVEMRFEDALAEIGRTIHGIETAGALMLARQHLVAYRP
jgi:8-oxo-dGTP pyrophosphatase MutT (NUDIX family)